jgi:two-component system LytT family sensor kinase
MTDVKRGVTKIAAVWGVWTFLAIVLAGTNALYRVNVGEAARFWQSLRIGLLDYWIWAALTPIIFYLAKRFRFRRGAFELVRTTAIHFCFYLLLTLTHGLIAQVIGLPAGAPDNFHGSILRFRFVSSLYEDLWMYWPLVMVWSLFEYYARFRERDMRAAQLKEQLAQAELQALRSQLHPHFLFNTLNSIASLMHDDVNGADDMLADLSSLLRAYLNCQDEQEVPLRRELSLLETYVRIQKRRFEDRLLWLRDVPGELLDAAIPALLLQPLVENSIVHGIAPRNAPGYMRLSARQSGAMLEIEVADNGCGLADYHADGIGLSNTRARLRQLYEDRCSFEMTAGESGGVVVKIRIPLRFMQAQGEVTVNSETQDVDRRDLDRQDDYTQDDTHAGRGRRTVGAPTDSFTPGIR